MMIRTQDVLKNNPKTFLDRLEIAGAVAVQADITSIGVRVFKYDSIEDATSEANGVEVGTELTFLSAAVVFNTLQTGGMWPASKDNLGYNLAVTVPASRFPTGGKYYRVEQKVTRSAVGADPFFLPPWIVRALPIASS